MPDDTQRSPDHGATGAARPALGDRALFPSLELAAYLNHAAISPWSTPVVETITQVTRDFARQGLHALFPWLERRERLREQLARLIGAGAASSVGLTSNTSHGVSTVALCMPWRPGDRVVLFTGEFPANVTPWQRAAELFQLELEFLELAPFHGPGGDGLARLDARLRARPARLVAVSAVQFQSGLRMPLEEIGRICRARGAELFVDAIQACGAVPIDVEAACVDYLSAGGHKWLMGPEGTGFLYARPERARALVPRTASWISHEDPFKFLFEGAGHLDYGRPFKRDARLVEGAAGNTVGLAGLGAAVALLLELGVESIYAHAQRYLDALERELAARGFTSARAREPAARSTILSVSTPAPWTAASMQRRLVARGISCSTPDGLLRFAPHWPNDAARELPLILDAVDALLSEGAGPEQA
ncbi:MAG: aminotransferase class V-fold PLP-dependent enzyme [Myxococcales bacterium]|nr:aminotransferase class V-fold PLP-dependent enzyme [Myxococcales bacterium]